jgi:hypothetical protein
VVGYPKPYRILLAFQDPGHFLAGGQDEGEGPGDMAFQEAESGCGYGFRVFGQVTQVVTDKGQVGFCGIYLFDPADLFHGFGMKDITAKTIYRIGGIDDDPAVSQALCNRVDMSLLWIQRVDLQKHKNFFSRTVIYLCLILICLVKISVFSALSQLHNFFKLLEYIVSPYYFYALRKTIQALNPKFSPLVLLLIQCSPITTRSNPEQVPDNRIFFIGKHHMC